MKPAYHIGILDFSPFPDYPEFYATNQMMNVNKHYIYNDNFTLNVLDLNQIHLATEKDKASKIDYWAKLFKAKTWEDLKMLAQDNNVFEETCETVYKLNQDKEVRYLCEMREEGQRILRTYQSLLKASETALAESTAALAEKDAKLAESTAALAEKDALIASLQAQLKAQQQ